METILVVDDDVDTIEALTNTLEGVGYRVFSAYDGIEAIDILENNKVDLVISDLVMPRMNGAYLFQAMKKSPKLKEVPFVILSCKNSEKDLRKALERGVDDYWFKPFSPSDLIKRVKRLFRQRLSSSTEWLTESFEALEKKEEAKTVFSSTSKDTINPIESEIYAIGQSRLISTSEKEEGTRPQLPTKMLNGVIKELSDGNTALQPEEVKTDKYKLKNEDWYFEKQWLTSTQDKRFEELQEYLRINPNVTHVVKTQFVNGVTESRVVACHKKLLDLIGLEPDKILNGTIWTVIFGAINNLVDDQEIRDLFVQAEQERQSQLNANPNEDLPTIFLPIDTNTAKAKYPLQKAKYVVSISQKALSFDDSIRVVSLGGLDVPVGDSDFEKSKEQLRQYLRQKIKNLKIQQHFYDFCNFVKRHWEEYNQEAFRQLELESKIYEEKLALIEKFLTVAIIAVKTFIYRHLKGNFDIIENIGNLASAFSPSPTQQNLFPTQTPLHTSTPEESQLPEPENKEAQKHNILETAKQLVYKSLSSQDLFQLAQRKQQEEIEKEQLKRRQLIQSILARRKSGANSVPISAKKFSEDIRKDFLPFLTGFDERKVEEIIKQGSFSIMVELVRCGNERCLLGCADKQASHPRIRLRVYDGEKDNYRRLPDNFYIEKYLNIIL